MRGARLAVAAWMTVSISTAAQLPHAAVGTEANSSIVRLPPEKFPDLPRSIQVELRRRGCSIPQSFVKRPLQNVIRGTFTGAGTVDWAVLCSRGRTSTILVFRNGDQHSVAEVADRPDSDYVQGIGGERTGFSRVIGVASPGDIRQQHRWHGGAEPPALTHAGIDDAFIEKGSVVWYWHRGKWLQLTGSN